MLTMSTYSEKSWNSSEDFEENSSTSSPIQRRINNNEMVEVNGNSVITTHCVSSVIKPGDKQLHDPLQFVKIKSTELSQKAKEQIKLAEEVKITKEKIKEVEEEWQNNLLSWKSKRRQSKRNNSEELEDNSINNSRKIKTFNEILHEKAKSGHRIGYNLHHYLMNEEDDNLIDQSNLSNDSIDHTDHSTNNVENNLINENIQNTKPSESELNNQNYLNSQSNQLNEQTNEQLNQSNDEEKNQNCVATNKNLFEENSSNILSQSEIAQNNSSKREDKIKKKNPLNDSQTSINSTNLISKPMHDKINEINNQLLNTSNDSSKKKNLSTYSVETENQQDEKKKLSFKAKLSAFENLAKVETKKPIEKTPPVKNKLRISSSNNLIADKKNDEKQQHEQENNFSKRFTSKSNENLSKINKNDQPNQDLNTAVNKRSELNSTKSESNLNSENQQNYTDYQNLNLNDHTQSDLQISNQLLIQNQNEINKYDLVDTRSSNEVISSKDIINNLQQHQFDFDYEVSELSKRMQLNLELQMSTSPNLLNQNNSTHSTINNHLSNNNSTSSIHSTGIHAQPSNLIHQHQYINSMEELTNNHQTTTNSFFNDDYANSQLYNQQITSNNLAKNLPQHMSGFPSDTSNQFYQPVVNKQSVSSSILSQTGNNYFEENVEVYDSYFNASNQSAYQLPKHTRSTSSSHLEYTNGLPPVTNQMYYQNKSPVLNTSNCNLSNNCLPVQSYSATQLMNRQSQPQLNLISPTNQSQLTQTTQSYNYNHWLIQEAELRRQIASRNGSNLKTSTKNSQNLESKNNQLIAKTSSNNIYKEEIDQPVYENTIIYNSHKKQQQLHKQQLSASNIAYLGNQQQINKPPYPYPNPTIINNNQTTSIQPHLNTSPINSSNQQQQNYLTTQQQKQQKQILSVSGKKKCSNCGDELGRGCAAMVIESLSLYFHINCFRCSVCHLILGNGTCGTDVRVRNHKLHCIDCYSNDEGKGIFY